MSIEVRPNLPAKITGTFLAFWMLALLLSLGISLFMLVEKAQLLATIAISFSLAVLWTGWHRLTLEDEYTTLRYTRYGFPRFLCLKYQELERAILVIGKILQKEGRPEVSLDLIATDGRRITIFLGLYTPRQGREYVSALACKSVNVAIDVAPGSR